VTKYFNSFTTLLIGFPSVLLAQSIPPSVEPGRIADDQRPVLVAPARLPAQVSRLNQDLPDAALAQEVFVLGNLTVVGNTVLPAEQLQTLTAPLQTNAQVTALQVVEATRQLRAAYAEAGYGLAVVHRPLYGLNGQRVDVRIEVVEGYVEAVGWPDDPRNTNRQEHWSQQLRQERPLRANTRYRYESLAKELPGLNYTATLVPGSRVGATRLEFGQQVNTKPSFNLNLSNRGTEASGPWQISLGGTFLRPTGGNDRLTFNYSGTLDWGESHYLYAQYDTWVGQEGAVLSVYGSWSDGDPGTAVLNQLDYQSGGLSYGIKLTYPVLVTQELDLRVFGGLEYGQFGSDILNTTNTDDRLTFAQVGLDARWGDTWFGEKAGASNQLTLTYSHGIEGWGDLGNANPNASRADGRVDFSKLVLEWERQHQFDKGWSLKANLKGQAAFTPLLSSQECGFGGSRYGRAFDSSALVGDNCAMLGLELAKSLPVQNQWLTGLKVFALADYGHVWQHGGADNSGSSIGLGLRGAIKGGADFSVEAAKASTDAVGIDEDWRVFGSLGVRW